MNYNVMQYLEATVKKHPLRVAYRSETETVNFAELYDDVRRIGSGLSEHGITKSPIIVFMDKGVSCLKAMFGVVCSGNFYCPIDVNMPIERIAKIIKTVEPKLVVTATSHLDTVKAFAKDALILNIEELLSKEIDDDRLRKVREGNTDEEPLYVLFTSGSTGDPKGVVISHKSVIDYIDWITAECGFDEEDIIGNQAEFHFDLSVSDVYLPLKTGCCTDIIPHDRFSFPVKLMEYLDERKITTIIWIPSALKITANLKALDALKPQYIDKILFCGEIMPNKQLNYWRRFYPEAKIYNLYGPTEATVACTYYRVDRPFEDEDTLPIGRACENTQILLLEDDRVVNDGEIGEICVSGSCLSLGYYNNPEKTDEVFTADPTEKNYRKMMYHTGDLAKYNENHELIYLGRKDSQIKHMGYRIELGEIETVAGSYQGVDFCACVYDDKRSRIVLYYSGVETDKTEYTEMLKTKLPVYMMPARIVYLDAMPMNKNDKIDRRALKEMVK